MHKKWIHRIPFAIALLIRASIAIAIILAIFNQRYMVLFISSLTMILSFLPVLIERRYKVYLTTELELLIVLFIYASFFLGEVHGYYTKFWWWDALLHAGSGIALGLAGFLIMYTLYYEKKIKASPILIAVFSFSFAVAIGAVWEIFEFTMDSFFGLNMQKSGIVDTMWDLIVDSIGAFIVSTFGYFYVKKRKSSFFERIINRFICENPNIYNDKMCKKDK